MSSSSRSVSWESARVLSAEMPTTWERSVSWPSTGGPTVDMPSSMSWESGFQGAPSMVSSASLQSVSSENASHRVPMRIFEGHTSKVRCVCFYPDENKLVSGSGDGTLRIWDWKTGAVEVLKGHTFDVWGVDVSRDGKMVVSGSWDKTVRIWNGELGETIRTMETQSWVKSVQFSNDSSRVVVGLEDSTARVWSVETGKLAFEPIKCHRGSVECVRYSPSGDRIASASGPTVQIWNAETGVGILSIRDSAVSSLAWTADDTYLIGGARGSVAIWNSHNGEQLRTWKAHDNIDSPTSLSLSPTKTHLASSKWDEKIPFIFDVSTGEQVAALWHGENVNEIAYSPSGKFIATACQDNKVYLWQLKLRPPSFSSFLDRPAVPQRANDGRGIDGSWDHLPNRNQHPASPQPHRFNRLRHTFTNLFTRKPAIKLTEIAAGKDKPYAATIDPPKFNRVQKILYTIIHCRKPDDDDDAEVPATAANKTTPPDSSQAPAGRAVIDTQPESIEMKIIRPSSANPKISTVARASSQPIRSTTRNPWSLAYEPSSSTPAVSPLSNTRPKSPQPSPQDLLSENALSPEETALVHEYRRLQAENALSPEEMALVQEYRRLKGKSVVVRMVAEPISGPAHDRESLRHLEPSTPPQSLGPMSSPARDREPYIHPEPSTPPRSPSPITSNTPRTPCPSSPRPYPQPSQSTLESDPLLNVVPALLSPSPLSVPSHHSHSLSPALGRKSYIHPEPSTSPQSPSSITSNTARAPSPPSPQLPSQPPQSTLGLDPLLNVAPGLVSPSPSSVPERHSRSLLSSLDNVQPPHLTASVDDVTLAETPVESATHSVVRRPSIDEED